MSAALVLAALLRRRHPAGVGAQRALQHRRPGAPRGQRAAAGMRLGGLRPCRAGGRHRGAAAGRGGRGAERRGRRRCRVSDCMPAQSRVALPSRIAASPICRAAEATLPPLLGAFRCTLFFGAARGARYTASGGCTRAQGERRAGRAQGREGRSDEMGGSSPSCRGGREGRAGSSCTTGREGGGGGG